MIKLENVQTICKVFSLKPLSAEIQFLLSADVVCRLAYTQVTIEVQTNNQQAHRQINPPLRFS